MKLLTGFFHDHKQVSISVNGCLDEKDPTRPVRSTPDERNLGLIAFKVLCSCIPRCDMSLGVERPNRVLLYIFDRQTEPLLSLDQCCFRLLALRDVADKRRAARGFFLGDAGDGQPARNSSPPPGAHERQFGRPVQESSYPSHEVIGEVNTVNVPQRARIDQFIHGPPQHVGTAIPESLTGESPHTSAKSCR